MDGKVDGAIPSPLKPGASGNNKGMLSIMTDQYRRLAVFVDCPSPGSFLWIVLESTDDPAVWLDLETGDDKFDNWLEAYEAGNAALLCYIDDELAGPVNVSPNEDNADE